MKSEIEVDGVFDANGDLRLNLKGLSQEVCETLKALNASPQWKVYRVLLMQMKEAYFNSIMAMKDPNDMIKNVGVTVGLNFAINQLPVLVADYERRIKKQLEEKEQKEKGEVFKRG